MAYQILGLREYLNKKTGKLKKRQVFYERQWRVKEPELIFKDPKKVLEPIPEAERINLYFTVADCFEGPDARKLREQWLMPFDIDELGLEGKPEEIKKQCLSILEACCSELMLDASKTAALYSGNGLQFFVKMHAPILSEDYFDTMREHYKVVCDKLQARLTLDHIKGKVDDSVFSPARLMRLPETWNEKPNKGKKWAFVVQPNLSEQDFVFDNITGDAEIKKADTINKEAYKLYAKPDKKSILAGCAFLKHCKEKPNDVSEHQWYAMLGVVAFLQDGENLAHEYSSGYAKYDTQETQEKYEQALRASGPRTCKDIGTRWDGCKGCAHYGTVTSPIGIRGEDYMATAETGFRNVKVDKYGIPHPGPANYEDLERQFLKEFEYIKVNKNGMYTYSQEEKVWKEFSDDEMNSWTKQKICNPCASVAEMKEFLGRMKATNVKEKEWLDRADRRHINFKNGVLDQETMTLLPHESKYGFKYILPYDYDPRAKAPRFEKFLMDVLCEDQDLIKSVKEFAGYCISGDEYWEHRAMLLYGDGHNGKSKFLEILEGIVGTNNVSHLTLTQMHKAESRYNLVNKLFNWSDESSINSLDNSEVFKQLASGTAVEVRHYYQHPFDYFNKAKLMISCNTLPYIKDTSNGMFRRLIIVPFDREFTLEDRDVNIVKKVMEEASGIYNTLITAYKEAKRRGMLYIAPKSERILGQYRVDSDPEIQFMQDRLRAIEGASVESVVAYQEYVSMCEMNGYKNRIKPANIFAQRLHRKFPGVTVERETREGKRVKVYRNLSMEKEF